MTLRRYFFDTEFFDRPAGGFGVEFISIGMVAEDDREFYGVQREMDAAFINRHSPWLRDNVMTKLPPWDERLTLEEIRQGILALIEPAETVEFWARNGSYDNFVLCRLFGGMTNFQKTLEEQKDIKNLVFRDINELKRAFGKAATPAQPEESKHIAICDARQEKKDFDYYKRLKPNP